MCLAVPGKVIETGEESATVDLQGNRISINTVLTPEVIVGEWVLVHAGFAITTIEESAALETWDYLREAADLQWRDEAGIERDADGSSDARD
jgi:hydrogenase expression/formation protein HypC